MTEKLRIYVTIDDLRAAQAAWVRAVTDGAPLPRLCELYKTSIDSPPPGGIRSSKGFIAGAELRVTARTSESSRHLAVTPFAERCREIGEEPAKG